MNETEKYVRQEIRQHEYELMTAETADKKINALIEAVQYLLSKIK